MKKNKSRDKTLERHLNIGTFQRGEKRITEPLHFENKIPIVHLFSKCVWLQAALPTWHVNYDE